MHIRLKRYQWVGGSCNEDKRVLFGYPFKAYLKGRRSVGRPTERWTDAVDRDTRLMLKCKN
jgi:hypothetical protein